MDFASSNKRRGVHFICIYHYIKTKLGHLLPPESNSKWHIVPNLIPISVPLASIAHVRKVCAGDLKKKSKEFPTDVQHERDTKQTRQQVEVTSKRSWEESQSESPPLLPLSIIK